MPTMPKRTWSDGATGAWSVGTSDSSLLARRLPVAAVCRNRRRGKVALIGGDLQHQFTARRMSATKTIFTTEARRHGERSQRQNRSAQRWRIPRRCAPSVRRAVAARRNECKRHKGAPASRDSMLRKDRSMVGCQVDTGPCHRQGSVGHRLVGIGSGAVVREFRLVIDGG